MPAMKTAPAFYTAAQLVRTPVASYHNAIGSLRAFIVVMVVAHQAVLAYHPYAAPPPASLTAQPFWQAFPVVDAARWRGFSLFAGFNDVFFMLLLFLLSGLFVWQGLERKGSARFLGRAAFSGSVPFTVAAGILAPLAYYPAYLQTSTHTGFAGFCHQWLSLGQWPSGPAWFVWVIAGLRCHRGPAICAHIHMV